MGTRRSPVEGGLADSDHVLEASYLALLSPGDRADALLVAADAFFFILCVAGAA